MVWRSKISQCISKKFKGVMICNHYGVGLAPWNTKLVEPAGIINNVPNIRVKIVV